MSGRIVEGPPDNQSLPYESLGLIFYYAMKKWDSNRIVIVDWTKEEITYQQVLQLSVRLATKLRSLGIGKGAVLTIISQNHWKYLATILACFYNGITASLLNHDYTSGELKHFLSISKPNIIFCTSKTWKNIFPLSEEAYFPSQIISYDDETTSQMKNFDDFLGNIEYAEDFRPIELEPKENVAFILTSSGTMGLPKCVPLTHANFRITMVYAADPYYLDVNANERIIGLLPLFHIFGNAIAMASILYGTKLVLLEKFHPERFLNIIQDHKITKLFVVPPILLFLIKSPLVKKYDLSSITYVGCGGAPLLNEISEMVKSLLKINSVCQIYGMTEICGASHVIPKDYDKPGSIGKVTPTHRIKVADVETERILPPHQVGELRVQGDSVMKGYLGNQTESENAFDEEGFLKSGDLGYYDEEDYFYVVDRLKELIKYKGFQVSPAELENLLLQHPAVKDAGVVGKPDERAGEVPVAFVVKQPNQDVTEQELITYVSEHLSIQKHLYGGVRFIEEIPKSSTGKILRRKLKELI